MGVTPPPATACCFYSLRERGSYDRSSHIGSKTRGLESDSYLNHSTGVGRVSDADWTDTPNGRVKPVYKDAILNKRDLRVALTPPGGGRMALYVRSTR